MPGSLLLLPGDGIGPEVVREVRRVAAALPLEVTIDEAVIGGASLDRFGIPIRDEVIARAKESSAVLVGAVGGPQWRDVPRDLRPEAGLLRLRSELDAYANLRPAVFHAALKNASPLQSHRIAGLDLMIVRELTSGVYFGEPRGITRLGSDDSFAVDTQRYTVREIRRVARKAFEIARTRRSHVTSADKANVMETGVLWRETVQSLRDEEFPDVVLEHLYADACGLRLVTSPSSFDVVVTDNLFGDVLSDVAAGLVASIGMLPSASLGADGGPGLYEPIHGSAPDIAGQGISNPIGAILSFAMALEFSLNDTRSAEVIRKAVDETLSQGIRTADIGGSTSTEEVGMAIAGVVTRLIKDNIGFF